MRYGNSYKAIRRQSGAIHHFRDVEMRWIVALTLIVLVEVVAARPPERASSSRGDPAKPCDPAVCKLPDCRCSSDQVPGGLEASKVPQVLLRMDWSEFIYFFFRHYYSFYYYCFFGSVWFDLIFGNISVDWLSLIIAGGTYHFRRCSERCELRPIRGVALLPRQSQRVSCQSNFLHIARVHRLHTSQRSL